MKRLRLGTRRSLLAMAQSAWVAKKIESLNPDHKVELVGIETQGDRILDVPLSKIEGKEFFVAELDQALLKGDVDLTVHSMKDLSLDRPKELCLAAVPKREDPRDLIIWNRDLHSSKLRLGTSSPRRMENIPKFLEKALPFEAEMKCVEIRGNINTRLKKLGKEVDGVVLAQAGLNRMVDDDEVRDLLPELLKDKRFTLLPISANPSAPAQGALAIECRSDSEFLPAISRLHDSKSLDHVKREREILSDWGGGCHQRLGATVIVHPRVGEMLKIKGIKPDGTEIESLEWNSPETPTGSVFVFNGTRSQSRFQRLKVDPPPLKEGSPVFVAHSRALPEEWTDWAKSLRIFTSGLKSWFELAQRGIWVEGSAESLGAEWFSKSLKPETTALSTFENWTVLTHESAAQTWKNAHTLATYKLEAPQLSQVDRTSLERATHVYWSSASQFEALAGVSKNAVHHACGLGKTAEILKEKGAAPVQSFPSVKEWEKWLGSSTDV